MYAFNKFNGVIEWCLKLMRCSVDVLSISQRQIKILRLIIFDSFYMSQYC